MAGCCDLRGGRSTDRPARQTPLRRPLAYRNPDSASTQPTASPTPTATAEATDAAGSTRQINAPRLRWDEPDGWSIATPTVRPTPRVRSTATPTRSAHRYAHRSSPRCPAARRLHLPPARAEITRRVEGWVERINGSRWTIDGVTVKVTGATQIIGDPGLGWKVSALVREEADGSYTALQITSLAPPEATPEPYRVHRCPRGDGWRVVDHWRHARQDRRRHSGSKAIRRSETWSQ